MFIWAIYLFLFFLFTDFWNGWGNNTLALFSWQFTQPFKVGELIPLTWLLMFVAQLLFNMYGTLKDLCETKTCSSEAK